MKIQRAKLAMSFVVLILLFAGCTPKTGPVKIHADKSNVDYIQGETDGCLTAKGNYTKDHHQFKTNTNYHEGWFGGRQKCQIAIW